MLARETHALRRRSQPGGDAADWPSLGSFMRSLLPDWLAAESWFTTESPRSEALRQKRTREPTGLARLGASGVWEGPGTVGVKDGRLVMRGQRTRSAGLSTVERVERTGALVWVRRRRAHDWLIACTDEAGAIALVAVLSNIRSPPVSSTR